ncbi:MAG: OmpA family protein [Myxococcaceae bacterium]
MRPWSLALAWLPLACVSGNVVRARADVLRADMERARAAGAMRCAPVALAQAEAHTDFAVGELDQGESGRAQGHIEEAEAAATKVNQQLKNCPAEKQAAPALVVTLEDPDGDTDGIPDTKDRCPKLAEDRDGFEDEDGCPDLDNDQDGVLDTDDLCPRESGPALARGCPTVAPTPTDSDGDGIDDTKDGCKHQAEDKDGFADEDGCPDADNDEDGLVDAMDKCPNDIGPIASNGCPRLDKDDDGIPDSSDKCPGEPEDKDGYADEDGCPDLDNDQDGVSDTDDACPTQPGSAETRGCPKQYSKVVVTQERIEIRQQIQFKTGSAKILGKSSFAILREVAQALADNPQIRKVRIEGHTDSIGRDSTNLRLSQDRADAVKAALVREGVDPGRLEAVGFGSSQPIASNASKTGRAQNRRTEFNIAAQDPLKREKEVPAQ